jgi:hypothetical protein
MSAVEASRRHFGCLADEVIETSLCKTKTSGP